MVGPAPKVVVIDDSAICLEVAASILEESGHCVVRLESACSARQTLLREEPDLVLVDVDMPVLPGDRLVALLLRDAPSSLAVLYSDRPELELARLAAESGAAGFIPKSVGPAELVRRVDAFLATRLAGRFASD